MKKTSKYVIGAGVAAAVAAGVFGFFTQHPKGKKLAKQSKKTIAELTHIVASRAEKIQTITQAAYNHIVDEVMDQYAEQKKMTAVNAAELAKQLKKEWSAVKKELQRK